MDKLQALVVDDNWYNCDIFRIALERAGYSVEIAYNGRDGLELLLNKPYKILVIDLQMPGIDGVGVLKEIQDKPFRKEMYVLVVTASAYMITGDVNQLYDMMMSKPISVRDLTFFLERIKNLL